MITRFLITLLVCASGLLTACEPVHHYNRLQVAIFQPLPKRPYGTVKVYFSPAEVTQPYEVIGLLSCEGSAADEAGIINAMPYRAADMGGDGVIVNTRQLGAEDVSSVNVTLRNGLFGPHDSRAYRAQVIHFKSASKPIQN